MLQNLTAPADNKPRATSYCLNEGSFFKWYYLQQLFDKDRFQDVFRTK